MRKIILIILSSVVYQVLMAQSVTTLSPAKKSKEKETVSAVQLPYNRFIRSAGNIITYGNPELENLALDIAVLPDKKFIAVEDRYGIMILDAKTNKIKTRWSFSDSTAYKDVVSTYSGITSFFYRQTTYLVWGAQGEKADRGFVVIAQINNGSI